MHVARINARCIGLCELSKLPDTFSKEPLINTISFFINYRLYEEAIDCAFEQRDVHSLYELQKKIQLLRDQVLIDKLGAHIATLEARR